MAVPSDAKRGFFLVAGALAALWLASLLQGRSW